MINQNCDKRTPYIFFPILNSQHKKLVVIFYLVFKTMSSNIKNQYIIRPPYLYGPMNNIYREAFVFDCAINDLSFYIPNDGKMKLQFFYIKDLCRFIEKIIINKPNNRIYNVGNKEISEAWNEHHNAS